MLHKIQDAENRKCIYEGVYDVHRYRAEVLISSKISDFSVPTLPLHSRSRSLLYYTSMPLTLPATPARPFIPNKAIQNPQRGRRSLRAAVLGDNLYTRATYVITYSLDTSFSRARRHFHGFVPPRLVTARRSHCCATIRKIARSYDTESWNLIFFNKSFACNLENYI